MLFLVYQIQFDFNYSICIYDYWFLYLPYFKSLDVFYSNMLFNTIIYSILLSYSTSACRPIRYFIVMFYSLKSLNHFFHYKDAIFQVMSNFIREDPGLGWTYIHSNLDQENSHLKQSILIQAKVLIMFSP